MVGRHRVAHDGAGASEKAATGRSSPRKRQLSKRMQEYMDDQQKSKRKSAKSSKPSIRNSVETGKADRGNTAKQLSSNVSSKVVEVACSTLGEVDSVSDKGLADQTMVDTVVCSTSDELEVPLANELTETVDMGGTQDSCAVLDDVDSQGVTERSDCPNAKPVNDTEETILYDQPENVGSIDQVLEQSEAQSAMSVVVAVESFEQLDETANESGTALDQPIGEVDSVSGHEVIANRIVDQSQPEHQTTDNLQQQVVEETIHQIPDTFDVHIVDQSPSAETEIDQSLSEETQIHQSRSAETQIDQSASRETQIDQSHTAGSQTDESHLEGTPIDQSKCLERRLDGQEQLLQQNETDETQFLTQHLADQSALLEQQVADQSAVLEQASDQSQTLDLGIHSTDVQDTVVAIKADNKVRQTSSNPENVEILLSSDDTATQALLESFMQDNSDTEKVKVTHPVSEQDNEFKEHRIAPNIKLTERVQVDENGKKHTVVYISADNTDNTVIHNNSRLPDGLPLIAPAGKMDKPLRHSQQIQGNHDQRDMVIEVYVGPQPQGGNKIQDVKVLNTQELSNPLQTSSGLELFSCNRCEFTTDRKFNLAKHVKIRHDDRPHICPVPECSYSARTFSNLKRHQLTHSNERQFQCPQCELRFKQKIHLDKHINYIHRRKCVKCAFCDYVCANRIPDLKLHMKRRHLKNDPLDPPTYLECEHCGFLAASKKDLKQHFKFHKRGPELKLFCEHCSFVTDAKSRLARHRMIHTKEKPFSCTLCGYRASQKEHIRRHHRTKHKEHLIEDGVHTDEPSASLSVPAPPGESVSIADTLPSELPQSLEDQHTTEFNVDDVVVETSVELSSADQTLTTMDDMTDSTEVVTEPAHSVTVGGQLTTEKKMVKYEPPDYSQRPKSFACTHCTMRFVRLLSLYKHLHTQHSDILENTHEEKLTCVVCDFKAQSHKALLVHMRKHNSHEACDDEDPGFLYVCVLCKYMNSKRRNLYQHLKKKHKISMMVKKDGTVSCVVEPDADVTVVSSSAGQKVTEVVGMTNEVVQTESQQVADLPGTEANRVVNLLDLANSLTHKCEISHLIQRVDIETGKSEQAAAEAIVDLATQNVMVEEEVVGPLSSTGILESDSNGSGQLQLTEQQLQALSTGDFIEINGETYKVEMHGESVTAVLCDPPASTCSYVQSTNEETPAFSQSEVVILADASTVTLPT